MKRSVRVLRVSMAAGGLSRAAAVATVRRDRDSATVMPWQSPPVDSLMFGRYR